MLALVLEAQLLDPFIKGLLRLFLHIHQCFILFYQDVSVYLIVQAIVL